jgi:hypothetical protein
MPRRHCLSLIALLAGLATAAPAPLRADVDVDLTIRLGPVAVQPPVVIISCRYGSPCAYPRNTYRKAPAVRPAPPPPTVADGRALIERGRFAEAAVLLEGAAGRTPQDPDAWHLLGQARRKSGDGAGAERDFARALRIDPGHPGALQDQGLLFLATGRAEAAQANLALLAESCGGCRERTLLQSALTGAGYPPATVPGAKWLRVGD